MPSDPIRDTLEDLGLSDKEIALYLMLLTIGTTTASILGESTGIQRSTAQYTCQQLEKKGIIRMVQKGNMYLFSPEPPQRLLMLLDNEREIIEQKEERVQRIIGSLKDMLNPHAVLPKVRFFEGRDGIIQGYQNVLDAVEEGGEILSYLHALEKAEDIFDLSKPFEDVTNAFTKKRIRNRLICPHSAYAVLWQKGDTPLRETRLLPDDAELAPTEIMLFHNSIFAIALERNQLFGYLAENASITGMHQTMFNALWSQLPPSPKAAS